MVQSNKATESKVVLRGKTKLEIQFIIPPHVASASPHEADVRSKKIGSV